MLFSIHAPARNAEEITRRAVAAEALGFHLTRVRQLAEAGVKHLLLTPPMRVLDEVMDLWGREVIPACADID